MENKSGSSRHSDFTKSFKLAIRSLLTSCSKQVSSSSSSSSSSFQSTAPSVIIHNHNSASAVLLIYFYFVGTNLKDFIKAFSDCNTKEQESLHRLFIQMNTKSLCWVSKFPGHYFSASDDRGHLVSDSWWEDVVIVGFASLASFNSNVVSFDILQDEFESLGLETQVGTTLDTVDQLLEEQHMDPLFSKETNVMDVVHSLSIAKENEIQCLMSMLERAEEQRHLIRARTEQLKKRRQDVSSPTDVKKLRSRVLSYWTSSDEL
ncbi:hypothetical protein RCOM_0814160 [Ricinus communis]|uniref:Uncharacterized protein n=1 Tax=Ricinus communis TaxID=3988 RepID=B9RY38_RICCO|nr:hypothetical protein RCOM_0814160 [Ricinus communis]